MSKIALLTPTFFHFSGIDRVVQQQATEYSKSGHKVTVFALDGDIKPQGYNLVLLGMPKNHFIQRIYRLFFFMDFMKIKKAASEIRDFEVAISHFYPMNWIAYLAKKRYGVEYAYHNHGVGYSELFGSFFEKVYMKLFGFFNRISLENVDAAFSISKFMQKELRLETGIESSVVYNKIDKSKFKKGLDGTKIRKRFGIRKKMLLFVGRLSPHKNVHGLLKIFDSLKDRDTCTLVIVGKPTFPKYFRQLKESSGKDVIFVQDVGDRDLPHYYAACDLYVTASLWEGFDLPAAEAQACGKKVVAYDICSHPEIIKNGVLVRKNDENAFADAILKLLK